MVLIRCTVTIAMFSNGSIKRDDRIDDHKIASTHKIEYTNYKSLNKEIKTTRRSNDHKIKSNTRKSY